jgi:hypothetical protein
MNVWLKERKKEENRRGPKSPVVAVIILVQAQARHAVLLLVNKK